MNIVICCNDNYMIPARTLIDSIAAHNKDVVLWLIYDDVSEENLAALKHQTDEYHWKFNPVRIPDRILSLVSDLPCHSYFTKEIYYRLFIPWVMSDCERALYLDCDMLVRNSLEELYLSDLGTNLVGAVPDMSINIRKESVERLRLKGDYYNSGMLLMQLGLIRKQLTEEKMLGQIRAISEKFRLVCPDQDIINIVYDGKIKEIDRKYNYFAIFGIIYKLKNRNEFRDAVIVHFLTANKPWKKEYCRCFLTEYWKYLKKYMTKKQQREYWMYKPCAYFKYYKTKLQSLTSYYARIAFNLRKD